MVASILTSPRSPTGHAHPAAADAAGAWPSKGTPRGYHAGRSGSDPAAEARVGQLVEPLAGQEQPDEQQHDDHDRREPPPDQPAYHGRVELRPVDGHAERVGRLRA